MKQIFRSLRTRNYRIWTIGSVCSNVGTWMQFTAQDWLVLTAMTHHDATAVGIVMALQLAPPLLFLPWTGHVADRFEKRLLLMGTQAAMGTLSVGLGALILTGHARLWHVDLFAFVFGCVAAFDAPARQTFVGELVGEENLSNAVALNSMSFNVGRMIGPAVGGVCIAEIGSGWAFVLNGASFFIVFISLQFLRVKELFRSQHRSRETQGLLAGFRYVWKRPDLRAILVMLFLIGTFGFNFPIFISTMAVQVFHVGAHGYGMLTSIMAMGTLIGAALAAGRETATFSTLPVGAAIFTGGCLLGAFAPDYAVFGFALVVLGISSLTFTATTSSLMQMTSDPGMRGRVIAIRLAVFAGGTPLGAPIVGWVANHFGARWALGVGGLAGASAAVVALMFLAKANESGARDRMASK